METPRGQAGVVSRDRLGQRVTQRTSARTMGLCLGGAASANGSAAQAEPPRLATGLVGEESDPEIGCALGLGRARLSVSGGPRFALLSRGRERA